MTSYVRHSLQLDDVSAVDDAAPEPGDADRRLEPGEDEALAAAAWRVADGELAVALGRPHPAGVATSARYLNELGRLSRPAVLSDRALRQLARLREAHHRTMAQSGREPSHEELAASVGLPIEQVDNLLAIDRAPRSTAEPVITEDGAVGMFGELLADPLAEGDYERVLNAIQDASFSRSRPGCRSASGRSSRPTTGWTARTSRCARSPTAWGSAQSGYARSSSAPWASWRPPLLDHGLTLSRGGLSPSVKAGRPRQGPAQPEPRSNPDRLRKEVMET
jgi:hypothetical protein